MPIIPILPPNPTTQVRPAGATRQREETKRDGEEFSLPTPTEDAASDEDRKRDLASRQSDADKEEPRGSSAAARPRPTTDPGDDETVLGRKLDITV